MADGLPEILHFLVGPSHWNDRSDGTSFALSGSPVLFSGLGSAIGRRLIFCRIVIMQHNDGPRIDEILGSQPHGTNVLLVSDVVRGWQGSVYKAKPACLLARR